MNTDTTDFLTALLFVADPPDHDPRLFERASVEQFSPEFVSAVDGFIQGFRDYLESREFDMDRLDSLDRPFGANVFFSLSGHGVGFFDEPGDDGISGDGQALGDELQKHLDAYSGNSHRFEELACMLEVSEDGVIDIVAYPEEITQVRAKLFGVKGYIAVPFIVYVPESDTSSPPAHDVIRKALQAQVPGAMVFAAEDFQDGRAVVTGAGELPASITAVCPRA